ncbi:hypothetical protein TWF481_007738 [Arthrobotrys musiformis]|uniref:Uncharacterized protein n=1 Tax=Arthrobotrys musiformis TaxID=47236 RepID=A0AAV9WDX2_9PEZI
MIRISIERGFVCVLAGGKKYSYELNTYPRLTREEVISKLGGGARHRPPPVMSRLLKLDVVYEAVLEALDSTFEGYRDWEGAENRRSSTSDTSYLSGSEPPLDLRPSLKVRPTSPAAVEVRCPGLKKFTMPEEEPADEEPGLYTREEWLRLVLRRCYEGFVEVEEEGEGERKENLCKKLVAPESDVKAPSGGEKGNSPKQKTYEELLEEVRRMAGRIERLEEEVAELRGKLRTQEGEEEEEYEEEEELQQWGPARGQQGQILDEDVDLIEFDDPSDFEKVLPAEDGGDDDRVAVVTELEPLVPIPSNTTQLIVVATETGAAAGILERVREDVRLCRGLVYLEVRGGQLDIEDDDFCQLIQLCPDLVGVAVRGGVNLTDVSMRCVLTSCQMICGLELSGQPSTPGKISSRPLQGISDSWLGYSLRELILKHQPAIEEEEVMRVVEEERPCLRVTLAVGEEEGGKKVVVASSWPPQTYQGGVLERWVSLRGELWTEEESFRRSQEGMLGAVREGVARSSVPELLVYRPDRGGLTWMLDDYQMEGVKRVNVW